MTRTEVTTGAYQRFTSHRPPRTAQDANNPKLAGTDLREEVTGRDAKAYCEWAGGRLPTEAEWEYAAEAASGIEIPVGNTFDPNLANSSRQIEAEKTIIETVPVRKLGSGNGFDLFDMVAMSVSGRATSTLRLTHPRPALRSGRPKEGRTGWSAADPFLNRRRTFDFRRATYRSGKAGQRNRLPLCPASLTANN